jgi:trigger factor
MSPPAAATEAPNTVNISDAGPSRKKVSISVPADTVSAKLKESLEAQLPGFRKGRAPRGLVEKRFGPGVREETKRQLVAQAFQQAVQEHKLQVVGEPVSEMLEKVELKDGKPLEFDIEVEVMPTFELPSLEGIEVRKPTIEVTDAMVAEEVRKLKINEGRLETLEGPEPGDYLTGRGVMKGKEGTTFYDISGAVVQVPTPDKEGKGMILGIMVDDFAKQLGLPKPGETATITAKGPEQHEIEGVRNNDLTITFKVERSDRIIPASTEEVLAVYGMQSEDQLNEGVRMRMNQRVLIQQQSVMRQQIAQHLIDKTEMDLPERLTTAQAGRVLQRQRLELMYRGFEPAQVEERIAELRAASHDAAGRELKLSFILNKAAEDLRIQVTEAEMNGRIGQLAMERNVRPEALRQELIQRNQVGGIFQQIREHKTFDAILAKATITEMPQDEFNKVMAEEAKARGEKAPKPRKSKAADADEAPETPKSKKGKSADADEPPEAPKKKAKAADADDEPKPKSKSKKKG